MNEVLYWLKENHPDILDEWNNEIFSKISPQGILAIVKSKRWNDTRYYKVQAVRLILPTIEIKDAIRWVDRQNWEEE